MKTFMKTNHQLKRWLPSLKVLALATSMTVGLAVSESVWAGCNQVGTPPGYTYYVCAETAAEFHVPPELANCQAACVSTYKLTLNTTGTGTGTVSGGGSYPEGTKVDLIATADTGSTFAGWSSGCSSGMTLTANTTCTATFNRGDSTPTTPTPSTPPLPENMTILLQVDGTGHGKVTTDTGLSCQSSDCQVEKKSGDLKCNPQACTQVVKTGSTVTVTATADSDSVFSNSWGGNENCGKDNVLMDSSILCVAYFHRLYKLTVAVDGPGIVTGKTLGYNSKTPINCGQGQTQCNNTYESTIEDSLQAQPLGNAQFQGWSGDCSGSQNPVALNLSKDATCQATFTLPKLDQIITHFTPATSTTVDEKVTLTATGGASGQPVTFANTTADTCTVSGSAVTFLKAGTCTLTANQAGNDQYNPAPTVTANIEVKSSAVVAKKDQVITNFVSATSATVNTDATLTATGGASGNAVTFASTTPAICTVSGQTVKLVAPGTCTVTADQAGNDQYNAALQVTATITVNSSAPVTVNPPTPVVTSKQPQTITILSFTTEVGKTTALKVTGGGSQNPVKLLAQTTNICTVAENNVTFLQVGECHIEATQSGNDQYYDAQPVTVKITVTPATSKTTDTIKQNQVITAVSLTSVTQKGMTITAQGGGSNNPILFTNKSADVCTISNNIATFLKVGTCILTVDQAGNAQYNPAPQVTFTVGVPTTSSTPTSTCAVLADMPVVNDTCDGQGKVASKTNEFGLTADISNIVIDHPVTNQGILRNISVTKQGKIDSADDVVGALRGEIHNEGTLCNFELTGSFLAGGTLCGNIYLSRSMVKDVTLAENSTLNGGLVGGTITCQSWETSILKQVSITAGTKVNGCNLGEGTVTLEDRYGVFTQTKGKGNGVIRSNPIGKDNNGFKIVELTAVADDNSGFTRWENDKAPECTGRKETVQVLVNDIKTCIAYFYVKSNTTADNANSPLTGEHGTLKMHMKGSGYGVIKPTIMEENSNGVNKVKLTVVAGSNSVFGEWEGDNAPECVGTKAEIEVVVEGEKTCTAYFDAVSPDEKRPQKISIEVTPNRAIVGGKLKVKTSGGASGQPVTVKTNSPDVCSFQNNTLTLLREGTCSITADQAGEGQYLAADPQTVMLTVLNDKATIIGKVSSDKDNSGQLQTATTADTLNISFDLKAAPNDVGQEADILLAAEANGQWFKATADNGWVAWDKNMASLGALTRVRLTAELINLPIYQGTLPVVGTVNLFATYRLNQKVLRFEDLPKIFSLSMTAPPQLETAQATCAQQGGIYFSQQCLTKLPLLAEAGHFSGGIYRFDEPQAGLQTVVNLPCRLGKRIAILGSFQNEYSPGIPVEIVVGFLQGLSSRVYQYNDQGFSELPYIGSNDMPDLNLLSGRAVASLPSTFAGVVFEGELPSKGQLYAYFGYRLKNPDGSTKMLHYSMTPLVINVAAESCSNSGLELEVLPLGTGRGNVFSNELGSDQMVLSALPANDSVLTGWQGDAEGCTPHPIATLIIKPSADKHTCQPVFERKTPLNCDETNPTCPVISEPCSPQPRTSKWILGIGPNSIVQFTNHSSEARDLKVNLFDPAGTKVGSGNNVLDSIKPLATLQFDATALKDMIGGWTGNASMEVLGARNLTVVSYIRGQSLVDSMATHRHRLYNLTAADAIRISNTSGQEMPLSARLFDKGGNLILAGKEALAMLPNNGRLAANASVVFSSTSMPEGSWIEIYPQAVERRCTGEIQLQHLNANGINVTSSEE